MKNTNKLRTIFSQKTDFRRAHKPLYDLDTILFIGRISVICGAESWNEIEDYAKAKLYFLLTFLDLSHGIPSHDTFNRLFSSIDSEEFESCFIQYSG